MEREKCESNEERKTRETMMMKKNGKMGQARLSNRTEGAEALLYGGILRLFYVLKYELYVIVKRIIGN